MGGGGVKLFGVQLCAASPMKKSFSMDCLPLCYVSSSTPSPSSSSSSLVSIDEQTDKISNGYLSDGLMGRTPERKKGVPWTEEEHRLFLAGLEKLGKGDWRGISRNFVTSRTPTQVASHAQKYFLRQNSLNKKKRRTSLFDVVGSSGKTVQTTESFKFKDGPFSHESYVSSLRTEAHGITQRMIIDLNSSEQESNLPPQLHLMPNSLTERPLARLPLLDLELSISSPTASDHPGTVRVS